MSSTSNLVRAEYRENSWTIINPDNGVALPVDQILMDVDSQGDGFALGIVLSVHGLDHDVAQSLSPRVLRALGVGFPNRIGRTPRGAQRVRCVAGKSRPVRA